MKLDLLQNNAIVQVYEEQDIEKMCPIPSCAIKIRSDTTLTSEGIRTCQTFMQIEDGIEYSWDVEKLNGKIISINMRHITLSDNIFMTSTSDASENFVWDEEPVEKLKPKPKRRILL